MLSLNKHIKLFSDFVDNHGVIKSFGFGDSWEWFEKLKQAGENLRYPAMFVAPVNSVVSGQQLTRTYTVFFCARQRKGEEDENDQLSDCENLALGFMAYIYKSLNDDYMTVSKNVTLEPHTEFGVDYLVAYSGQFSIIETFEYNNCIIPLTSVQEIFWYQTTSVDVFNSGYLLKADGGTNNDYNTRCPYSNHICIDGVWDVSFTLGEDDSILGVTNVTATALAYSDIDFAFLRKATGFYVLQGGELELFVTNSNRDLVCRITSDGSTVKYYYDDVLVYTSLHPVLPFNYMLKASMYLNSTPVGITITDI